MAGRGRRRGRGATLEVLVPGASGRRAAAACARPLQPPVPQPWSTGLPAIARALHTVFLEAVPNLTPDLRTMAAASAP